MAADVTLIALPAGDIDRRELSHPDGGVMTGFHVMLFRTDQLLYPDDEFLIDSQTGERLGVIHGEQRAELDNWFYGFNWSVGTAYTRLHAPKFEHIGIGPWSPMKAALGLEIAYGGCGFIPPTQEAIFFYFQNGLVLTPGVAKTALAIFNRGTPDNTIYRDWAKRGTGSGKRKWRSSRFARPRNLNKWFEDNMGKVVWSESW